MQPQYKQRRYTDVNEPLNLCICVSEVSFVLPVHSDMKERRVGRWDDFSSRQVCLNSGCGCEFLIYWVDFVATEEGR